MKAHDFIRSAIGNKVYITGDGDLGMNRSLRGFISNKTELTLLRLTKGGKAIVIDEGGIEHSVPPRNVREVGN